MDTMMLNWIMGVGGVAFSLFVAWLAFQGERERRAKIEQMEEQESS